MQYIKTYIYIHIDIYTNIRMYTYIDTYIDIYIYTGQKTSVLVKNLSISRGGGSMYVYIYIQMPPFENTVSFYKCRCGLKQFGLPNNESVRNP